MFVWKQLCVTQRTQNAPQVCCLACGKMHVSKWSLYGSWDVRRECLHISQRPISVAFHCANSSRKVLKTWRLLIQGRQIASFMSDRCYCWQADLRPGSEVPEEITLILLWCFCLCFVWKKICLRLLVKYCTEYLEFSKEKTELLWVQLKERPLFVQILYILDNMIVFNYQSEPFNTLWCLNPFTRFPSKFHLSLQFFTCSPRDHLQWMGAVRMRVQTADKNITIIHK